MTLVPPKKANVTPKTGRQPRGQVVYDKLLAAVERLIVEMGPEQISIVDVLAAGGVARATLYHHFGDLDALIGEACVELFGKQVRADIDVIEALMNASKTSAEFAGKLNQITEASQSPERKQFRVLRARLIAFAIARPRVEERLSQCQSELTDRLANVMASAQERGLVRTDIDSRAAAVFVQAYTLGRIIDDIASEKVEPAAWVHLIACTVTEALISSSD